MSRCSRHVVLLLVAVPVFLVASVALAGSRQLIEVVAFSEDSRQYALRVVDQERGLQFQVRDTKTGDLVKAYGFLEDEEKRTWAKVVRKHAMNQEIVDSAEHPRKELTMLATQKGDKLVLLVMKGDRIKAYDEIDLRQGLGDDKKKRSRRNKDDAGPTIKANLVQLAWDKRGKYAVVIYHKKVSDTLAWESDFALAFKFKSFKAAFE